MLIDTHSHLYWDSFKPDLDQVIKRSIEAGVTTIINVGVDVKTSETALKQIQNKLNNTGLTAYSTVGIHPHEATNYTQDKLKKDIEKLEDIYMSDPTRIVGIGECGLDYSRNDEKELQRKLFQAQINLAKKLNLPLIVHCRDDRSKNPENSEAWNEVLDMIGNHPAILHCYSGLLSTTNYILPATRFAREARRANLLVSFAATLTYPKNEFLREAVKLLPIERIVLETDCPFLPPQSKRGQRNEPASVLEIAKLIAELKGITFNEVASQTTENVKKILRLRF